MSSLKKLVFTLIAACTGLHLQAQMPNTLKPEEKVYGLSKFWQEVNYNFVYLDKVDRHKWDSLYVAMIPVVEKTPDDYTYYKELMRFCAFLKDGHTNVNFPAKVQDKLMNTMFGKYRFFIENIDGKAVITHTNLSIKDEVPTGSEVTEVNGLSTADYLAQDVKPYIASSTDYVRDDQAISNLLRGMDGQEFAITIKTPKGIVKKFKLSHARTEEKEIYPEYVDHKLLDFKWYPNDVAYVALNSFGNQKIDTLFIQQLPELYKAKSLIIDLRNNGGGSTSIGTKIFEYLTNDKLMYGSKSITRVNVSAYKAWGYYTKPADTLLNKWSANNLLTFQDKRYQLLSDDKQDTNDVKDQKVVVPTVLLIGHNTASAAEDFLIYADKQRHMTKIGENTYGSTGQPFPIDLPGGGSARICTKKDTYPDGREFVGYGVKPDIEVKPTVKDFIQNNDPALKKALRYLKDYQAPEIASGK